MPAYHFHATQLSRPAEEIEFWYVTLEQSSGDVFNGQSRSVRQVPKDSPLWLTHKGLQRGTGVPATHATVTLPHGAAVGKRLRSGTDVGGRAEMWLRHKWKAPSVQGDFPDEDERGDRMTRIAPVDGIVSQAKRFIKADTSPRGPGGVIGV